jgi:carboxylate-amine ligase
MREFIGNEFPTVGVEQEFHLIDAKTGDLKPCVDDIFACLDGELRNNVTYELYLAVLEHQSNVCRTIDQLYENITTTRKIFADICRRQGTLIVASATHPFAKWIDLPIVKTDHYQWVVKECGYIAQRLLSFGLHIHVGMKNIESAMYTMYEMRRWVYPLLAMSANSPFFEAMRTGLASTRTHLMGSMPRTGITPYFKSFEELEAYYEKLLATKDVNIPGELWWALRPQPPFGTVELRIFDLPTDARRLCAFAAITQATMAYYQDSFFNGENPTDINQTYLEQNRWKAMRHGLECDILDPLTGRQIPMKDQIENLLEMIAPKAEELGSTAYLDFAREILKTGTESDWQIKRCKELNGNLKSLELELAERTLA